MPKGTNRWDYEPEVYAAWKRERMRQYKALARKRAKHRGYRDATFFLSQVARDNLTRMAKALGMTKSQFINHFLEQCNEPTQSQPVQDVRPQQ